MKNPANIEIKTFKFKDDGFIPNHPIYPLLVYKNVLTSEDNPTDILANNNWLGAWRGGVFSHHHYHSNSHEVLVVVSGYALLQLGGSFGTKVTVQQGDVVILPAGFGHRLIESSKDFNVIGAYPNGQRYDLCTGESTERPRNLENIKNVPLPDNDPLFGENGPLFSYWPQLGIE